jgi:hypothetical protein
MTFSPESEALRGPVRFTAGRPFVLQLDDYHPGGIMPEPTKQPGSPKDSDRDLQR